MGSDVARQADVRSLPSLVALEAQLSRFGARGMEAVERIGHRVEARVAAYDARVEEVQGELDQAIEALQEADEDDDVDWRLEAVADARAKLRTMHRRQREIAAASDAYRRAAARFSQTRSTSLVRAVASLRLRIQALHDYLGVALPDDSPADGEVRALGSDQPASGGPEVAAPAHLTDVRLPVGFTWVRLEQVELEDCLPPITSPGQFTKVPYETMREGMIRLQNEILPRLHSSSAPPASEDFRRMDQSNGDTFESGLQRIYEAFFGQDVIYLVRGRGQEKFEVINGRHRLRVARDLGWDAVPVQVKDLNASSSADA